METTNSTLFFKERKTELSGSLIIIAYKLQTPENIGALIRLAGNVGASKVVFLNPEKQFKDFKIKRIAGRAIDIISWEIANSENPFDFIPSDYKTVALETFSNSTDIYKTSLPKNMALIVGAENDGIPIDILKKCDHVVFIPLTGPVQSMNVTQAASVATFEWVRQSIL